MVEKEFPYLNLKSDDKLKDTIGKTDLIGEVNVNYFTEIGRQFPIMTFLRTFTGPYELIHHRHDYLEIIFVVSGRAIQNIGSQSIQITPGDVFFINPTKQHGFLVADGEIVQYISFSFLPQLIDPILTLRKIGAGFHYSLIDPFFVENHEYGSYMKTTGETFDRLLLLALLTIDTFNRSWPVPDKNVINLFRTFMSLVYKEYCKFTNLSTENLSRDEKLFLEIQREIDKRIFEKFTLEEIAKAAGIGRTRLTEIYKEVTGESIIEYARRKRAEKAAELLVFSDLPIIDIAFEAGFHDLSYFNRTFRHFYEIAPGEYREKKKTHR